MCVFIEKAVVSVEFFSFFFGVTDIWFEHCGTGENCLQDQFDVLYCSTTVTLLQCSHFDAERVRFRKRLRTEHHLKTLFLPHELEGRKVEPVVH